MASAVSGRAVPALVVGPAEALDLILPDGVDWEVDHAESAADAILHLARKPYLLVLINHTAEGDLTEEQICYIRAVRAIRPTSRMIVLVSHTTTRKVIESLRNGVAAYFTLPLDFCAVRDAIAQVLSIPNWSDGVELLSAEPDFISVRLRCCLHAAERLSQFLRELPCTLADRERSELSTAFREMLLNAIEHGGKLDPNEWVSVSRVRTKRTIVYHIYDPGG
jgi:DNA-binding NarL/FixJ family response regulator